MKQLPPIAILLFIALISCDSTSFKAPEEKVKQPISLFQNMLDSIYQLHPNAIGLMMHVEAPDQNISWSGAVGFASREDSIPLKPEAPALIASNTKSYVAAAIMNLVEDNVISLESSIDSLLTPEITSLFLSDGYVLSDISVSHLLSHTSGIFNYVDAPNYIPSLRNDPMHHWTRLEQLTLATSAGDPLYTPGSDFTYADTNYLLLTIILEEATGKPFYDAISELLEYDAHGLNATWFHTLEEHELDSQLVTQYWSESNVSSKKIDVSMDLYGGGGIASNTKELALFSQLLFENKLFKKEETLQRMLEQPVLDSGETPNYSLGLTHGKVLEHQSIGHGGFWGTTVNYFPELNASVSIFVLERDERIQRKHLMEGAVQVLKEL